MDIPPPSASESVLVQRHGPVLVLTLNRPSQLNAWTDEMQDRYFSLLAAAESEPDVRAIVVTGAGKAFCAGADFGDLADVDLSADGQIPDHVATRTRPLFVRKPVVAAINGAAAGLGLVEALYCDVRFAVPDAKLTTAFTRRGLIAEYGAAWLLERIVGYGVALDLLLSARIVTGSEALTLGLVNRLAEPEALVATAIDYARDLADHCSPSSMAAVKRQVREAASSGFDAAAAYAETAMRDALGRTDLQEGIASFLERRAPEFPGLEALPADHNSTTLEAKSR